MIRFRLPRTLVARTALATVIAVTSCCPALADVFSVGSVNPVPPAAGGVFSTASQLLVGDQNATNNADTRAFVSVDDGTLLQYGQLIVGNDEYFLGEVVVDGDFLAGENTQFNFSASAVSNNPTVQIGNQGTGILTVGGGSTMNVTSSSGMMSIGFDTTGIGYVTIKDPWTILTVEDNLYVGQEGIGTLEVLNGALVTTIDNSSTRQINIGATATGVGLVVVDGFNSVLRSASTLVVGNTITGTPTTYGQGTLRISNGGIVEVNEINVPTITVGRLGRIEIDGGTLLGNIPTTGVGTTVNGYLGGSGHVRGTTTFTGESTWGAGPGQVLRFHNLVNNQGAGTIINGEVRFLGALANNAGAGATPPGRITLENGTVYFSQGLTNNGVISSASGATNIHGAITNTGNIVVARDTVATFNDNVNNTTGTITILPGGNALFLANLSFQSMAFLSLGVGMSNLEDTSGQIGSGGIATLGGSITVNTEPSYTPTLGDSFELLTADGGIVGTFNTVTLPNIPGTLEYRLLYSTSSVRMEVAIEGMSIALGGDYNDDGIVDALDYTVWRNNFGQLVTLPNDETPGEVTAEDYDVWKANYGETLLAGSGGLVIPTPSQVPEPPALFFLMIAGVTFLVASGRRSRCAIR
jgi:T5SS/PEP-CTERM-associated repeat protein